RTKWDLVMRSQERFKRELGDRLMPDIVQLINDARDERDAEILDAVLRH
ncbi:MAG: hypothetical protein QOF01_216, partial [Thermomicrobiales bacterium]|nr:hypothetical protein [Thermomicrobiales bacterium]